MISLFLISLSSFSIKWWWRDGGSGGGGGSFEEESNDFQRQKKLFSVKNFQALRYLESNFSFTYCSISE